MRFKFESGSWYKVRINDKHTNFQFVDVNLFPTVVLALILDLNNYHLVVMCRADVADTVEV